MTKPSNMTPSEFFETIHSSSEEDNEVLIEIENIKEKFSIALDARKQGIIPFWKINRGYIRNGVNYLKAKSTSFFYKSEDVVNVDLNAYSKIDIANIDKKTNAVLLEWFKETFKKPEIKQEVREEPFSIDTLPEQWEEDLNIYIDNTCF